MDQAFSLIWIRIQLFSSMQILIQLFTLMRNRILLLFRIKVTRNCGNWSSDPDSRAPFWASTSPCERPPSTSLHGSWSGSSFFYSYVDPDSASKHCADPDPRPCFSAYYDSMTESTVASYRPLYRCTENYVQVSKLALFASFIFICGCMQNRCTRIFTMSITVTDYGISYMFNYNTYTFYSPAVN
jgi:hypothetical protein